jgi:predicted MFS family arabinose efflux permease
MATNRVETITSGRQAGRRRWLNRNVIGMAVTSFLSDAGHEMVTAILPGFLSTLGVAASALGWIEGVSDASSSFVKLGSGWYSDRIGHRKAIVSVGYFLTGTALALFAAAISWPLILLACVISWFGRGVRSPLRDAMRAESVTPDVRGKAFGLHRAGDTVGAIIGPLLGVWLLSMGTVNGIGDLTASVLVGTLWTAESPAIAFDCAAAIMLLGALLLIRNWRRTRGWRA